MKPNFCSKIELVSAFSFRNHFKLAYSKDSFVNTVWVGTIHFESYEQIQSEYVYRGSVIQKDKTKRLFNFFERR